MRYQSKECSCTIWLQENDFINIYELAYRGESSGARIECNSNSIEERQLIQMIRNALRAIREAAIRHRDFVHHAYRMKIDSLPPRLGRRAFTGQWVGLTEYSQENKCIQLVIEPKYKDFHKVYKEVISVSPRIARSLALTVAGLHLGVIGHIHSLNLALWLLEEYASRNPPYRIVEESIAVQQRAPSFFAPTVRKIARNEKYYATLATSISIILKSLLVTTSLPKDPLIEFMTHIYTDWQRRLASYIASSSHVAESLHGFWKEEPEIDIVLETLAATKIASPGLRRTGQAHMMLTPAPKIYEVYVLIKVLEALSSKIRNNKQQVFDSRPFIIGTKRNRANAFVIRSKHGKVNVYYNYPPRELSRFVYRATGSRPHPDILLKYSSGTRIVIDAKYKLDLALSPGPSAKRRLELKEALRLLGYVADLAHNGILRAILAVPQKASEFTYLVNSLDGSYIRIDVAEVNPSKGANELAQLLPSP